ncbi:MAG TPA: YhcH/YjgK/YiaL family protein [Candidatus Omnitrophota bacterium]|nr:YhcH/YjgK/YiaL family protein [Candidatus Omnitrophota bacterium]HRZ14757.1 YhcH/YjgK/YiaL family protein [Candidatus Omnitrophota bacterium]
MAVYALVRDLLAGRPFSSQCAFTRNMKLGLEYLADFDPSFFDGKPPGFTAGTAIAGKKLYAAHQVYATRPLSRARFEAHRRYVDLQVVWRGQERILVAALDGLTVVEPYDAGKDIVFFALRPASSLIMRPGMVAVLYPSDAHAPCISYENRRIVAKTVVKVRI